MRALLTRMWRRLRNVVRWGRTDADLQDEIAFHIASAEAMHRARGLSPTQARREALREFGGRDRWTEASRSARGVPPLQDLVRDIRFALRGFRRTPGFAFAAVLVVALGVAAATSVFSVVGGVLLRPLPYASPESLYAFYETNASGALREMSYPTYQDVAPAAAPVADLAYARGESLLVRRSAGTQALLAAFVTPNFFPLLGVTAETGRTFGAADGADAVIVLSTRIAARMFGDARSAVGRTVATREGSYSVIGVMPPGFAWPEWADVWLPLELLTGEARFPLTQRNLHVDTRIIARVRDGVTADAAAAALGSHVARMSALHPEPGVEFDAAALIPLREQVIGDTGSQYAAIAGAVALVLLLACVNVAGLLLARGLARRGELSARLALGAGRGRLVRQMLTESALLALAGGAVGAAMAWLVVARLRQAPPQLLPRTEEIVLDGSALAFALGISVLSALLFGVLPAWRATSIAQASVLRSTGRGAGGDRLTTRLRGALVVVQVAIAVMLLVGAALLVRTARALGEEDLGFEPQGLLAIRIVPPAEYGDADAAMALFERLRAATAAVPGVTGAELVNHIPLSGAWMSTPVQTGRAIGGDQPANAVIRTVSPRYLTLLGARLRRGRLFDEATARGTGIVVNETLARREWGDENPVGREITIQRSAQGREGFGTPLPSYVLGVVEDVREFGATQDAPPVVYVPFERNVWPNTYLLIRAGIDTAALVPMVRAAINEVHADIPTAGPAFWNELHSVDDYRARSVQVQRFVTAVLSAFAVVALLLALIGLFAVLAYLVAQRTREIGVRMALGARPRDAAWLVLGQSARLVAIGLIVGMAGAWPASRLLQSLLFGVPRLDPWSYVAPAVLFGATALAAAWLPARNAARIDPLRALRLE